MSDTTYNNEVCNLVRKAESDWISGSVQTSKYVSEDFYDDINKIEAFNYLKRYALHYRNAEILPRKKKIHH